MSYEVAKARPPLCWLTWRPCASHHHACSFSSCAPASPSWSSWRPLNRPSRSPRIGSKGLTVEEVDTQLGRPDAIAQRTEGTLRVSTSTYRTRDRTITAEFVEGVLIRFSITSR